MKFQDSIQLLNKIIQFCNFILSFLQFLKIFHNISDSFKFQKFWTHNLKLMATDEKANIAVISKWPMFQAYPPQECLIKSAAFQVSIDLPGHGLSSHYPKGMTYKASDSFFNIHRVQDHLKWEKSTIIGHSMGKKDGISSCLLKAHWHRYDIIKYDASMSKIGFLSTSEIFQKMNDI
jgi:hypothetical protein